MTRDDIIDIVAAVDFEFMGKQNWNAFDKYERFGQLVAAAEREACDSICEDAYEWAEKKLYDSTRENEIAHWAGRMRASQDIGHAIRARAQADRGQQ